MTTIVNYILPENPPNIETHEIYPKKAGQEGELYDECCNRKNLVTYFRHTKMIQITLNLIFELNLTVK